MENPLDTKTFELKRLELRREDAKAPVGVTVVEKPGRVVVVEVRDGSAAAKCGFKVGDILLAMDGRSIVGKADLSRGIEAAAVSSIVVVARRRETPLEKPTLPTGKERKSNHDYAVYRLRKSTYGDLGVQWAMSKGSVIAKAVTIGALGHQSGLKAGDCVLAVGDEVIKDVEQFKDVMTAAKGAPVDVLIERQPEVKAVVAKPQPKSAPAPAPVPELVMSDDLYNFQSVRAPVARDPSVGIDPPPEDVQILADQWREAIVAKIKPTKEEKPRALEKSDDEKRVQILGDISMRPLKKQTPPSKSPSKK